MALSRIKVWLPGDILTAQDLNNEFSNLTDVVLVEPATFTQNVDFNGHALILDDDGNSSIDATVNDTINVTLNGAADFTFTPNLFTALSGSSIALTSGNITSTAGALTITDGQTTLADPDARTATVATPLILAAETSSLFPAAGIGTGMLVRAESADEAPSDFGQLDFSATDVASGSEDTYFRIWLRVAGAALTEAYRWIALTAFKATFTHANSADRIYTCPDLAGTLMVSGSGTPQVPTTELKTTTTVVTVTATDVGDAAGATVTQAITLGDYAFWPSFTYDVTGGGTGSATMIATFLGAPSDTVGRFSVVVVCNAGVAFSTVVATIRWRTVIP